MHFRLISTDPPWPEKGGGKVKRGADRHYPVMSPEEILRTHLAAPAWRPDTSCHLWCWATNNWLPSAIWLVERLGFRYITNWVWVKGVACAGCDGLGQIVSHLGAEGFVHWAPCPLCNGTGLDDYSDPAIQTGLGQYQRGSHELLLFATRGQARVPDTPHRVSSVIVAPRTRHSAKPPVAYRLMELISGAPRLEMFARDPRPGWEVWGDEVECEGAASAQGALTLDDGGRDARDRGRGGVPGDEPGEGEELGQERDAEADGGASGRPD